VSGDPAGAWMTGILEVQLPMEFKLKNIEETEAAKKRMLTGANAEASE
jgi:Hepatocellular carcinoma-associated antigen 59